MYLLLTSKDLTTESDYSAHESLDSNIKGHRHGSLGHGRDDESASGRRITQCPTAPE